MKLAGSIALVTGANQGLGKCYAEELLRLGASKVYACALDRSWLDPLWAEHGERIVPLRLDVTQPGDIDDATRAAHDLTVLVNNAGVLEAQGLVEAGSLEPFRREMEVNVFGLSAMSLAFAPVIAANGGGAIVNMLSGAALANFPPFGTYCATKAAAMSITHCLRYELKARKIEVYGIYASLIDTDMLKGVSGEKSHPGDIAAAALRGVEAGIPDIDADARTVRFRAKVNSDPEGLEAERIAQTEEYYKSRSL